MTETTRLFVPLSKAETDRLLEIARAERRTVQQQAALLLAKALEAREREAVPA